MYQPHHILEFCHVDVGRGTRLCIEEPNFWCKGRETKQMFQAQHYSDIILVYLSHRLALE